MLTPAGVHTPPAAGGIRLDAAVSVPHMKRFCRATRSDGQIVLTISEHDLLEHLSNDPMAPRVTDKSVFLTSLPSALLNARYTGPDNYYRSALEYLLARAAAEMAFDRRGACWSNE